MTTDQLRWYVARVKRMTPAELVTRAQDEARRRAWARRRVPARSGLPAAPPTVDRKFHSTLPEGTASAVPPDARAALLASADRLMSGHWETLGVERDDLVAPDWFHDPHTGRRAPDDQYAFRIQHRSEAVTGNIKQVWELSRHQHLTLLAAAYFVSGEDQYARRVHEHLSSWWAANPFLTGVHWTSGIEIGLRLISWTWIRRLLDDWPDVADLFENNDLAVRQLYWHQEYLAGFRSRGSSANNHVIAEAAGRVAAANAFPWFAESSDWRADATHVFQLELARNTFPSGVNRELASEYHGFVADLAYAAAIEADAAGNPLDEATWTRICRMTDAAAALVDAAGRPPRQGDGDDGAVLLLDGVPSPNGPWSSLLALGGTVFGRQSWWPRADPSVASTLLGSLVARQRCVSSRPPTRRATFNDAGIVLMRTGHGEDEIWCRCDSGPHGFLGTAAHAHADALSVEVRHGGIDVLADPATYCYHGEPEWRSYFRSTAAHNTLELAQRDQSRSDGPFLWGRAAHTRLLGLERGNDGEIREWSAEHDGYEALSPPARHRRAVHLDDDERALTIVDTVDTIGTHPIRLHFLLGPSLRAEIDGSVARLRWCAADMRVHNAVLRLPGELQWSMHRGETEPTAGWYSPKFGVKSPTIALRGVGACRAPTIELRTRLEFGD